jgi:hypothetical protein
MGIELEGRTSVECKEAPCIARSIMELIASKLGIVVNIEEHVKKLAELVETGDIYDASFTVDGIEITIRDIYYDWNTDDCDYLDNCSGAIAVKLEIDGDLKQMKQIVMKLLKRIGADRYVKICE